MHLIGFIFSEINFNSHIPYLWSAFVCYANPVCIQVSPHVPFILASRHVFTGENSLIIGYSETFPTASLKWVARYRGHAFLCFPFFYAFTHTGCSKGEMLPLNYFCVFHLKFGFISRFTTWYFNHLRTFYFKTIN